MLGSLDLNNCRNFLVSIFVPCQPAFQLPTEALGCTGFEIFPIVDMSFNLVLLDFLVNYSAYLKQVDYDDAGVCKEIHVIFSQKRKKSMYS